MGAVVKLMPRISLRDGRSFPSSEYVQSLDRGLAVIRCFNEEHPIRTLSEVATTVGLTRAAARRFVLTLEALGYLQSDGKYFRLRPQTLELGYAYLASLPWWHHAQRIIDRLGVEVGYSCAVGVFDREAVAYVGYTPGGATMNVVRTVGTRLPAYATAMGHVLLGSLSDEKLNQYLASIGLQALTPFTCVDAQELRQTIKQVRIDGFAIVSQQLEIGLHSVGVPIRNRRKEVIAGLSLSVRGSSLDPPSLARELLPRLQTAAENITQGLPS